MVNERHAYYGSHEIDRSNHDVCPKRSGRALVGHMLQENERAVVDDGINARELAKQCYQNCHDQRFPERGIQQVSTLFRNSGFDGLNFCGGILRTRDPRQKIVCLGFPAFLHQPPRAFGNEQQREKETHRRNAGGREHPPPVRRASSREQVIHAVGQQNASDNRQLF